MITYESLTSVLFCELAFVFWIALVYAHSQGPDEAELVVFKVERVDISKILDQELDAAVVPQVVDFLAAKVPFLGIFTFGEE